MTSVKRGRSEGGADPPVGRTGDGVSMRRLRAEDRRAQILDVATTLFEADGYHSTSLEGIAREVGVAKASLYYYFKSKEDLLVALHQEMMVLLLDRQTEQMADQTMSRESVLRGIMQDIVGLMESHPGRLRIFFEAYRELPAPVRAEVAAQRRHYRQSVAKLISQGIAAGEFRECDPELTSLAVLGMCNWCYQWYRVDGSLSAKQIADNFHELIMAALRPH
jgi:AcrR family transcriptional regulator